MQTNFTKYGGCLLNKPDDQYSTSCKQQLLMHQRQGNKQAFKDILGQDWSLSQLLSLRSKWFRSKYSTQRNLLTHSMEQSPSWQTKWFSTSQEIPRILWNPKVHYRIHKCPPPGPILGQLDQVHTRTSQSILILSSHLSLGLPSGLFPSSFPTKTHYTPLLCPIRATCPTNLILQDLITWKVLGEQYRLLSSLCSFLHSPVTSSLLDPNTLLNTLFSNTLSLRSSLNVCDQVSHPYKTTGKIIVLYILIL